MKIAAKLLLIIAASLVVMAAILAVLDVGTALGSGSTDVRIPDDKIQPSDKTSVRYMAFWRQEEAEWMAIHFTPEDLKSFRDMEKKDDGYYATVRTGSERPGNPFRKSKFYFESYIVIICPKTVYLAEVEKRSDSPILEIKTLKEIQRLTVVSRHVVRR